MTRGIAFLALAGLATLPRALSSQDVPEALKSSALAVQISAVVPAMYVASPQAGGAEAPDSAAPAQGQSASATIKGSDWQGQRVKYTVPGTPAHFKLVGENLAVLVQITPFLGQDAQSLVLVAQGQVWVRNKEGGFSYHTAINTLSVNYGEKVLFFPLGIDSAGKAPLRLEITVFRAADLPASSSASGSDDPETTGAPGDKAGGGDKAAPGGKAAVPSEKAVPSKAGE